jgi:hypothetical protein
MTKSQNSPFPTTLNAAVHAANGLDVTGVLEAHENGRINLISNEDSELGNSLDDAAAEDEENDELEEENEVEAAAEANRS